MTRSIAYQEIVEYEWYAAVGSKRERNYFGKTQRSASVFDAHVRPRHRRQRKRPDQLRHYPPQRCLLTSLEQHNQDQEYNRPQPIELWLWPTSLILSATCFALSCSRNGANVGERASRLPQALHGSGGIMHGNILSSKNLIDRADEPVPTGAAVFERGRYARMADRLLDDID